MVLFKKKEKHYSLLELTDRLGHIDAGDFQGLLLGWCLKTNAEDPDPNHDCFMIYRNETVSLRFRKNDVKEHKIKIQNGEDILYEFTLSDGKHFLVRTDKLGQTRIEQHLF